MVAAFLTEVRQGIRREGGRHILAWTDRPMDAPLRRLIGGRGELGLLVPLSLGLGVLILGPLIAHMARQKPSSGFF